MEKKYESMIHYFTPEDTSFGPWSHSPQPFLHGEKDIPGSTLTAGFQVITAPVTLEDEPIFHREEETMFFLGAVLPDVFASWDAEVHFYMGPALDQMEKIVITEPTAVRVPKNYWHGPLKFVRVDKPVLFQAALFSGQPGYIKKVKTADGELLEFIEGEAHRRPHTGERPSVAWKAVNEDGVERYTDAGAYDDAKAPDWEKCARVPGYTPISYSDATTLLYAKPALSRDIAKSVLAMPKEITDWGTWMPNPKTYLRGQTYMEDCQYHIGWQVFTEACNMEEAHFHQGKDEYLFFMGANPMDMFDFEAEIDIMIGDDPDHMETYHINRPCVIRFPANVWHCPILFRKMKKPLLFQAAFQDGVWGTITRSEAPENAKKKTYFSRKYTYDYMGDNVRRCKFNEDKVCIICGKCFPRMDGIEKEDKES
jgi:hypothetical protein